MNLTFESLKIMTDWELPFLIVRDRPFPTSSSEDPILFMPVMLLLGRFMLSTDIILKNLNIDPAKPGESLNE